jgi:soluble lytic murein transglycosylase-like protein
VSTQAIGGAQSAIPAGELAAAARIRELQQLIEQARGVSTSTTGATGATAAGGEGSATAFAAALQAASAPASTATGASAGSSSYDALIEQAAQRNGVDPAVLHGLIQQESGFDPNAQSGAGASGLTQLMPGTASSLGVTNPLDPTQSIEGGARYLSQMMSQFGGNTSEALAAYNAGPGAVRQYGGIPPYPETQSYVSKVLGYAESYRSEHPAAATGMAA